VGRRPGAQVGVRTQEAEGRAVVHATSHASGAVRRM
jgi:hypothetical protein